MWCGYIVKSKDANHLRLDIQYPVLWGNGAAHSGALKSLKNYMVLCIGCVPAVALVVLQRNNAA